MPLETNKPVGLQVTVDDIEARWRPLTSAELPVAQTRLADAWRRLKREVPGIEDRFATEPDLEDDAIQVLADAVIRVLQALERGGMRKGSVGVDDATRSWELDASISTSLYFTDDELAGLSPSGDDRPRVYSVMPS